MAKEKVDLREKLRSYKYDLDLLQRIPCSKEENKIYTKMLLDGQSLPDGVFCYKTPSGDNMYEYYTVYKPELTEQELNEYLNYQKLSYLRTIKNCVVFFTVLTVISMIVAFLLTINI